jgi:hypothetical protein
MGLKSPVCAHPGQRQVFPTRWRRTLACSAQSMRPSTRGRVPQVALGGRPSAGQMHEGSFFPFWASPFLGRRGLHPELPAALPQGLVARLTAASPRNAPRRCAHRAGTPLGVRSAPGLLIRLLHGSMRKRSRSGNGLASRRIGRPTWRWAVPLPAPPKPGDRNGSRGVACSRSHPAGSERTE